MTSKQARLILENQDQLIRLLENQNTIFQGILIALYVLIGIVVLFLIVFIMYKIKEFKGNKNYEEYRKHKAKRKEWLFGNGEKPPTKFK